MFALKLGAWPKLLVPTVFGQAIGISLTGRVEPAAVLFGVLFTTFGAAFILLMNDWGDREVDGIKRGMFPESGSPKTIVDGVLRPDQVLMAGLVCGAIAATSTLLAQASIDRPLAGFGGLLCMGVFVAYTLPPLKLNYRGGGEALEMLGVGVALPLFNAYLQSGRLAISAVPILSGFVFLSLASAVASGLSDEESDRAGGKRTIASIFGNSAARFATEASLVLGVGCWLLVSALRPDLLPIWALLLPLVAIGWNFLAMRSISNRAVTNAFAIQSEYKRYLHRAIWHGTALVALMLLIKGLAS